MAQRTLEGFVELRDGEGSADSVGFSAADIETLRQAYGDDGFVLARTNLGPGHALLQVQAVSSTGTLNPEQAEAFGLTYRGQA